MRRVIKWTAVFIAAAALAGVCFVSWAISSGDFRFVPVTDEDELVEALIDNFSTGNESVVIWTKDFRIDRSRIASYVSSEISNDAEDLCIMPVSYTVGLFDFAGLWQFRLYYAENGSPGDFRETDEASGGSSGLAYSQKEIEEAQSLVSAELDRIVPLLEEEAAGDERAAHRAIFEYLCENVSYDYQLSDIIVSGDTANPLRRNRGSYGALIQQKTVCSGYAGAYKAICDRMGLDCWVAESEDHAWNLVRMQDGQVYCVDATSGDQDTWIADQFFLIAPEEYEAEYGYRISDTCYIPPRFRS